MLRRISGIFVLSSLCIAALGCGRRPTATASELFDDHSSTRLTAEQAAAVGAELTQFYPRFFQTAVAPLSRAPACANDYLAALAVDGRADECLERARQCGEAFALVGARCAAIEDRFADALALFRTATAPALADQADFAGRVFLFASFASSSAYADQSDAILEQIRGGRYGDADVAALRGAIEYELTGKSALLTLDQLESYVRAHVNGPDQLLGEALTLSWTTILAKKAYRFSDALVFLRERLPSLNGAFAATGHKLVLMSIDTLYSQPSAMPVARRLYEAYLPHARAAFDLPVEKNSYDYTTLYGTVCRESLTQGSANERFKTLSSSWKSGSADLATTLAGARALLAEVGDKADVLSFIGSLLEESGNDAEAYGIYWRSHQSCAYFHRAHWGLKSIRLRRWQQAFPDYAARLASIDSTLANVHFPESLSTYVLNYASLDADDRTRLQYSLRFWAPYIDFLKEHDARIYMKRGYELLSEAPGLEELKDTRIDYAYDYRLWDDVRGVGGDHVVVDRSEMRGAAFGAYNLGGHEVAHQFHFALPDELGQCIKRLYDEAKARDVFSDPYASTNETEYFAQGVTIYMVPADAPRAFGLTRTWIRANDPNLWDLLQSFERGDLAAVRCPGGH